MNRPPSLTASQRASLEAWENRTLSADEFMARVHAPWTETERESFRELVSWFQRRYPTAIERLASARSLGSQWDRSGT